MGKNDGAQTIDYPHEEKMTQRHLKRKRVQREKREADSLFGFVNFY